MNKLKLFVNKKILILIVILIIATGLRLYKIDSIPSGLTWDEASLGYNAYSILKTGRDEYGSLLPLTFKSFGDFKPALYSYLAIPFVATIGLNEIAVRLPSVLSGVLLVLFGYLLIKKLFGKDIFALSAALAIAVSPFAIQFSRGAFEANVALTFNAAATFFFIKGIQRSKFLILSAFLFGISLFSYQASRLFIPMLALGLFIIYRKQLKVNRESIAAAIMMGVFFIATALVIFVFGQGSRLSSQNLFAYERSQEKIDLIAKEDGMGAQSPMFQILHGEWFAHLGGVVERYLIYFSPDLLFIDGDYSKRHSVPDLGVLYFVSIVLLPLGIIYLLKGKGDGKKIIFLWLLIATIPAVLSRDLISTLRALNFAFPLSILEGAGIYQVYKTLRSYKKSIASPIAAVLVLIFLLNILFYMDRYFVHMPKEYSQDWLYGYKQSVQILSEQMAKKQYDHIVITDKYGQPYIYYLFYTKYPPAVFQKQAILDQQTVDVGTVRKIDNLEFRPIYYPHDRFVKNSLYIGLLDELPEKDILPYNEARILKDIDFLDNTGAFRIVQTNE